MWEKYWDFGLGRKRTHTCAFFVGVTLCYFSGCVANAHVLTPDFEVKRIASVGAGWQTVSLDNSYAHAVVVCTYNLPSKSSPSATTRIRNITASSFDVRIQQFENSSIVTPSAVHCLIVDEGAYTTVGGLKFEARTVISDGTSGLSVPGGWGIANNEDVTGSLTQSYSAPVVLGQVMSYNDVKASVFWSYNCVTRGNPPFIGNSRICVGKHIGQINGSRSAETIGYIVAETGSGVQNDMNYALALGGNSIAGVGSGAPFTYGLSDNFDIGVASQSAENGGQGGWAVLYGSDPLPPNSIVLAIDEEVVAGDKTRGHISENVGYWVFKDNQSVKLNSSKSVFMASTSISSYSIPGSDILYTIDVANTGSKPVDPNSIVIIDALPDQTVFYNGDIDDGGPETGTILFTSAGSGLSFTEATDLAFSNASAKPSSFAACTYTPSAGYDVNVNYVCLNPKGTLNAGSLTLAQFSLSFRAQVK